MKKLALLRRLAISRQARKKKRTCKTRCTGSQNTALPTRLDYPPFVDQVHGLSLALFSKSSKLKVFWWLVFFACASCGMFTTALVIIEYIQVPTATSITIKLVPSLELPAITICPGIPDALNYEPLFEDIRHRLPYIANETAFDLVRFWLGGSGFHYIYDVYNFNQTYLDQLNQMYKVWSEGYDTRSFFHRTQENFGYKCEEFFSHCRLGLNAKNCCNETFHPISVIQRGLCFQTRRNLNQSGSESTGILYIKLKPLLSVKNYTVVMQSALTVYIMDNFEHVGYDARLNLYPDKYTMVHLSARLVELQEHSQDCTRKIVGKDVLCFLNKWIRSHLLDPFNCTVPYMDIPGIPADTKVCDPLTIAKNYWNAVEKDVVENEQCTPGCTKWEYNTVIETRDAKPKDDDKYNHYLAIGYDELQYEHVREISTISISGLISQVGGQLGLYLGISIVTLLQIVVYCVNRTIRFLYRFLRPLKIEPESHEKVLHGGDNNV